jgi:hypothetical protein
MWPASDRRARLRETIPPATETIMPATVRTRAAKMRLSGEGEWGDDASWA